MNQNNITSRMFHIVKWLNDSSKENIKFVEQEILDGLKHKTIGQYAYILHDQDVYTLEDERKNHLHKQGLQKPLHYHIVIKLTTTTLSIDTIAKWFNVAPNFVQKISGKDAFINNIKYLTHETKKEKHQYKDDCVYSNFNFRYAIIKNNSIKDRKNYKEDKDFVEDKIFNDGMTLKQARAYNPTVYQKNFKNFERLRINYISETLKVPEKRINYYIYGDGGIGKGLMSKAIARGIYPNLQDDSEIFFEVGAKGTTFEGYDGQPVIIWNDHRAEDLLNDLGKKSNVFNVFDLHPDDIKQNVKFGSIKLCNEVNIVNSVQPYSEFLDTLISYFRDKNKKEDDKQVYRRFSFVIPIRKNEFDLLINKGVYDVYSGEYKRYYSYNNIMHNLPLVANIRDDTKRRDMMSQTIELIIKKHIDLLNKISQYVPDDEIDAYEKQLKARKTPEMQVINVDSSTSKHHDASTLM